MSSISASAPPAPAARVASLVAPSAFGAVLGKPASDAIALTGGSPAPDALPAAALSDAYAHVLASTGRGAALDYSAHQGSPTLRAWIAERESVSPDRVVITNGALHGLSLALLAIADPGDLVVVEDPVYPLALKTLQLTGARPVAVPLDENGLRTDVLEERLRAGLRPRALYTVPDFQNPTGRTLSAERRVHLVELAERYGLVVISDNPYVELRASGERLPDLDARSENVVRINSFSKTLGPGLRLGWIVVPEWLRTGVLDLRARGDQHASTLTQAAVAHLVSRPGAFDEIVAFASARYRERADVFVSALHDALANDVEVAVPEGGVFAWPRFVDDGLDLERLAAVAAAHGVLVLPGSQFAASDEGTDAARHVRASFAQNQPEALRDAALRLATALREARR